MRIPTLFPSADDLIRTGITENGKGNHRAAVAAFTRALRKSPKSMPGYANRASAYTALGEYDNALADLNRAISLVPVMAALYFNRGNVYRTMGDTARAMADYTQAVELDDELIGAYFNRGQLNAAENPEAALADLNKVLELKPDYSPAFAARGQLLLTMNRTAEAVADLKAFLARHPDAPNRADIEAAIAQAESG